MSDNFLDRFGTSGVSTADFGRGEVYEETMRYSTGTGKVTHKLYVPYKLTTEGEKRELTIKGRIHLIQDINSPKDKKSFKSIVCQHKDQKDDCPICNCIGKGWDVYSYKLQKAIDSGNLKTDEDLKAAKKNLANNRPVQKATDYIYLVVTQFDLDEKGKEILGEDGLPTFKNKIMKLTSNRISKITETLVNTFGEENLSGKELTFVYPDTTNQAARVSQSTFSIAADKVQLTTKYKGLEEKINKELETFDWSVELPKAFGEWRERTTEDLKTMMDDLFKEWDAFCEKNNLVFNRTFGETQQETTTTQATTQVAAPVVETPAPVKEEPKTETVEDDDPFADNDLFNDDENPLI